MLILGFGIASTSEGYHFVSGTTRITAVRHHRIRGTFGGTARTLEGLEVEITGGRFDVRVTPG